MKHKGLFIGAVIIVAGLIGFVFYQKSQTQQIVKDLELERYSRLVAEEKVVNTVSKVRQLENDLKASEEKMAKVQAVLKDQKSINSDLERQYTRLSKAKADLEDQLKVVISQPPAPVQPAEQTAQTPPTTQDMAVAQATN